MNRILVLVATALLAACATHQGKPQGKAAVAPKTTFNVSRNVTYTPTGWPQSLAADLYRPAGTGSFPAIVVIHGGGWEGRSRADMDDIAEAAAARGYVVMNVSYRFAPQWRFPSQLQDVQQAVLWLRANAPSYSVDPTRIGVWGYSAGAHLAALLGTKGATDEWFVEGARVQAVVVGGTPVDLRIYPDSPLIRGLMGVEYTDNPKLWKEASPIAFVTPDDPPVFLYHGSFDLLVGKQNATQMYAELQKSGVQSELYMVHGLEHITTFLIDRPVKKGLDFLDRQLQSTRADLASTPAR